MLNDRRARIRAEADRLQALFVEAGALPVEASAMQPADVLLDLYGEDIRARAFVTHDAVSGEQMMRPDFTVPVVQMHMNEGAEPARYTYNGPVWRKQKAGSTRPSEYLQVGFELFDRTDPARSDAEVFTLFSQVLAPLGLTAATGDMGILLAAVVGLSTTDRRKAALMRHVWRPSRFCKLLDRYGAIAAPRDLEKSDATHVGLRSLAEIESRVQALAEDAKTAPLSTAEVSILDEILTMKSKSSAALTRLREISKEMPAITPALDRMEARLTALAASGIDVDTLDFEASYGRSKLEYYDGFVFGFYDANRTDLPEIATGGRYDALTKVLGQGRSIPAVGGVIRPEFVISLREGV